MSSLCCSVMIAVEHSCRFRSESSFRSSVMVSTKRSGVRLFSDAGSGGSSKRPQTCDSCDCKLLVECVHGIEVNIFSTRYSWCSNGHGPLGKWER